MKPIFSLFVGLITWSMLSAFAHPFYISITDMFYNPDSQSIEITVRMFTDDLEQALEAQGTGRLFMATERQKASTETYVERYIKQHIALEMKGQSLAYTYIGQEIEAEHTWCYLEISEVASPSEMKIRNSLMLDIHDSQRNLVHVKVGDATKSLLLEKGRASGVVSF